MFLSSNQTGCCLLPAKSSGFSCKLKTYVGAKIKDEELKHKRLGRLAHFLGLVPMCLLAKSATLSVADPDLELRGGGGGWS